MQSRGLGRDLSREKKAKAIDVMKERIWSRVRVMQLALGSLAVGWSGSGPLAGLPGSAWSLNGQGLHGWAC